jgi:regulatory protein
VSEPAFGHEEPDAGDPLTDALARCYAHLARREHSVAELRARLERARFDPAVVEEALKAVIEQGYLDDERYARLLAQDRRELDGWGVERIRARMVRAGIDRSLIDITLAPFTAESERQAAVALLRKRFTTEPADARERQRAFALLIRQGFDSEVAYDAIRRAWGAHDEDGEVDLAS